MMLGDMLLWHKGVLALAAALMIAAAYVDARCYRIPNLVSLVLLALFPAYVYTAPQEVVWGQHLAVFGFVLAAGFFLYAKKFIGAGDVKLLAVISLWAGPEFIGMLLVVTTVAGGLLAVMTATLAYFRHLQAKSDKKFSVGKAPIPYGVAIAMGGLCTLMLMFHPALLS